MHSVSSGPELAVKAGHLPLSGGEVSENDEWCALTGVLIPAGVPNLISWEPGRSFTNQRDLAVPHSRYVSREAAAVLRKPFLQRYAKSVISQDGWFRFASNIEIAWFLQNPPTPPFIMYFSVAKSEHMIWCTPVSLSKDLFFVRLGKRNLRIYRPRLLAALEIHDRAVCAYNTYVDDPRKQILHAFLQFSRLLDNQHPAVLRQQLLDLEDDVAEVCELKEALVRMSSGEIWALGRIILGRDSCVGPPQPIEIERLEEK